MPASDAQLVRKVLGGDRELFGELVRRHQTRTLAAARHLLRDAESARDVAQEAFIEAFRDLGFLEDPGRFGQWLYGILRNRVRRHLRLRQPRTVPIEDQDPPEPQPEEPSAAGAELVDLLDRLPLGTRDLLSARYLHDMSYAEIAGAFGWTSGTARVKCCEARRVLRELVARVHAEGGVS